jgi:hypothetical protein
MTLTFFIHLIITVFGYIILALSYLGIGWFCSRILKISFLSENRFFSFVWIGWAITLLLLQVLNLFFSINAYSSIPILILGLISAIKFFKIERGAIFSVSRIYLFFLTISVLWVAIISMRAPTAYDSGLYHFNSVRWLNESPIVLGLGNLHGRLAFNQSFFIYVAYLNLYPLFNHGHNIANSFLLLILLAECLLYLSKYIILKIHTANFSTINLATIFFLPIIIYLALDSPISSPTPDVASSILQILIFIYFIRAIAIDEKPSTTTGSISQLMFILIISATAITIKLSNLFYVISICTILIFIMLKPLYVSLRQISLIVIKLIALPALIIFIWSLRGILLSGCPAYPSTIGCINAHWSVPIESVKNEANWVYSWARLPNETPDKVLNSWDWLTPWFYRVIWENKGILIVVYPLLIFLTGIILSFIFYVRQPLSQKANGNWFLIPVPILVGLSFWFYLAPDIRFAHSLFWIAPIAATIIILKFIEPSVKQNVFIILMLFFIINANIAFILIWNPQILTSISFEGYMPTPVVNLTEKTTLSGFKILVPTEGYQCWDSKIPCTPYFNPELNFIDSNIFPEFTIVESTAKR